MIESFPLSLCTIVQVCIVAQTITAVALLLQLASGAGGRTSAARWEDHTTLLAPCTLLVMSDGGEDT